jgi:hypothetical protein
MFRSKYAGRERVKPGVLPLRTMLALVAAGALMFGATLSSTARAQATVAPEPPSTAGVTAAPASPLPTRAGRIISATSNDALAKSAALLDGEILELAPGNYQGLFTITASNTTIRPSAPQGAVFVNDGRFLLQGQNIMVVGLVFRSQSAPIIELQGSGNIVRDNNFVDAGDGRDGSSAGIVTLHNPTPGWEGAHTPDGLNPPIVATQHRVEGNTFVHPKNTVYWQGHGVTNNVFARNLIQGPHSISGHETMAIKLGFGFAAEDTFTEVSYNTINDWQGWPYVIGVKSSSTRIANNLLSKGRLQIRYGHRNVVSGNVILDGDLHAGGDSNVISDNYVRTLNSVDNFGPLVLFGRTGLTNSVGDYTGTNGRPPFIMEFSNGQVTGNTLINQSSTAATITNVWYDEPILEHPMFNDTFRGNHLYQPATRGFLGTAMRNSGPTGPINAQRFADNDYHCATACEANFLPEVGGASTNPSVSPTTPSTQTPTATTIVLPSAGATAPPQTPPGPTAGSATPNPAGTESDAVTTSPTALTSTTATTATSTNTSTSTTASTVIQRSTTSLPILSTSSFGAKAQPKALALAAKVPRLTKKAALPKVKMAAKATPAKGAKPKSRAVRVRPLPRTKQPALIPTKTTPTIPFF